MLIKLKKMEAAKFGDLIYASVKRVLSEYNDPVDQGALMQALVSGNLEAWAIKHDEDAIGLITTSSWVSSVSNKVALLVYSIEVFNHKPLTAEFVENIFNELRDYAKKRGAGSIIGYTKNTSIINFAERVGADTSVRTIEIEV